MDNQTFVLVTTQQEVDVLAQTNSHNSVCPTTVERMAKGRLAKMGYPRLKTVECSFHNGTMILRGRVPTYYHKQLAQEALRDVTHVRQLVNRIEVV